MGLFSFVSSCVSCLVSGIKSVASGITSALATVGSSLGKAVQVLGPALGKWAGHIGAAIQVISLCVEIVSKITGLLRQNENVAEMGERALQAGESGITLESCNNDYKAYMQRLRDFELDPRKAHTETDKLMAGSLLLEKGLEELYPHMSTADLWPVLARGASFFTRPRLEHYARVAGELKLPFGLSLAKFFMPPADGHVDKKIYDFVSGAEKSFNPSATPNQMRQEFQKVREACAAPEPGK